MITIAGRGPTPKPAASRARRNKPDAALRVIVAEPVKQPALPQIWERNAKTGKRQRVSWPAETRRWWKMWGDSPLSAEFTSTDWSELLITARLHAAVVDGDLKHAAELRLRVAKFGATPEDRARLRITFAAADDAEAKRSTPPSGASGTAAGYGDLRAVD